ncbi:MAG: hypothetical protein ACRDTE_10200 [Pseudonocardiaceae bacterium]
MTGDRKAYFRVQQYYGEMLAEFHRRQADIAAEQEAKLADWRHRHHADSPGDVDAAPSTTFDEDDFSNNTWLR